VALRLQDKRKTADFCRFQCFSNVEQIPLTRSTLFMKPQISAILATSQPTISRIVAEQKAYPEKTL